MAAAAAKKAVAKKANTNVANIQEMLKQQALEMRERVGESKGNKIKIKTNKTFNYPDGRIEQGPINLVIVDFINRQIFYEDGYVEGEVSSPTCWAINKIIKDLKPSTKAPNSEGTDCASCPMNVWGTDGKGKACKMNRKLVVVDQNAEEPELMTLEVNKKSADNYDNYVNSINAKYELPPVAVITQLEFSETEDYPIVIFTEDGMNDQRIEQHFNLQKEAQPILLAEFEVIEQNEAPKKKKPVRKKRAVRRAK